MTRKPSHPHRAPARPGGLPPAPRRAWYPRRMRRPASLLLLLVACTPSPQPAPEASTTPAPATPAASPSWWCTCYSRSGPTPVTSCRKEQAECQRIEHLAREGGGSAILPRSLTHRCREILGEHPGDLLGDHRRWQPTSKPGAWVSHGACLLPDPPDVVPPDPDPPDIHAEDNLGGLSPGMSDAAARALLGDPPSRSEPDATAPFDTWLYPDRGLTLEFTGDGRTGPWQLASVLARPPCDLRTSRGVGLGDPRSSVEAAYAKDIPSPPDADQSTLVAVMSDDTMQFEFDPTTGALSKIYLARNKDPRPNRQ